jgi:hypothetical protein
MLCLRVRIPNARNFVCGTDNETAAKAREAWLDCVMGYAEKEARL